MKFYPAVSASSAFPKDGMKDKDEVVDVMKTYAIENNFVLVTARSQIPILHLKCAKGGTYRGRRDGGENVKRSTETRRTMKIQDLLNDERAPGNKLTTHDINNWRYSFDQRSDIRRSTTPDTNQDHRHKIKKEANIEGEIGIQQQRQKQQQQQQRKEEDLIGKEKE
ncbi:hypothetical protein F4703DRAFT_1798262 [Phycomyces blakesleeanus]